MKYLNRCHDMPKKSVIIMEILDNYIDEAIISSGSESFHIEMLNERINFLELSHLLRNVFEGEKSAQGIFDLEVIVRMCNTFVYMQKQLYLIFGEQGIDSPALKVYRDITGLYESLANELIPLVNDIRRGRKSRCRY